MKLKASYLCLWQFLMFLEAIGFYVVFALFIFAFALNAKLMESGNSQNIKLLQEMKP